MRNWKSFVCMPPSLPLSSHPPMHPHMQEQWTHIMLLPKIHALQKPHSLFPDLKQIIPELCRSVLSDCRILFTGVVPTNLPARKNPEWNTAHS